MIVAKIAVPTRGVAGRAPLLLIAFKLNLGMHALLSSILGYIV
jgi:hypothetical protein